MASTYITHARWGAKVLAVFAVALGVFAAACSPAVAAATPAWGVESLAFPTNFKPGGAGEYELAMVDETGAALDGSAVAIVDSLPAGLTVTKIFLTGVEGAGLSAQELGTQLCGQSGVPPQAVVVSCSVPAILAGHSLGRESMQLHIGVGVPVGSIEGQIENLGQAEGGGAPPDSTSSKGEISTQDAAPGLTAFYGRFLDGNGGSIGQAGATPFEYTLGFARSLVTSEGAVGLAGGSLRNVRMDLPRGVVAALGTAPVCTVAELTAGIEAACPDSTAVGTVETLIGARSTAPLYAVSPPRGAAAAFGLRPSFVSALYIIGELRNDGGVSAWIRGLPGEDAAQFRAVRITLWGRPADPDHDRVRGSCLRTNGNSSGSCPVASADPLLRLPTSCGEAIESTAAFDTWLSPDSYLSAVSTATPPIGCEALRFEPTISVAPQTATTDSPTGIAVHFSLPAGGGGESPPTADLRGLSVALPTGVAVNPAGGGGRVGCTATQITLNGSAPADCPDGSKIGAAQIRTPLADHPIEGSIYLASQRENPFGALFAVYLVVIDEQTGVELKLAGKVDLDPETGQPTISLADLPQIPIEDISLELFDGKRALLRTPLTCGTYVSTAAMRPWSAPQSGPDATRSSAFVLRQAPAGDVCPESPRQAPYKPSFSAGTTQAVAGSFSPFTMSIAREDGSQGIGGVDVSFPAGLAARLAGISLCAPGAAPCPEASRVGSVSIWAGAGPLPIALRGVAYLSGAYEGAPASLTIEVPAVAGPFDLGTVRSRLALYIDPETARLRVRSDALPTILSGVPLDLRTVRIDLDRRNFILNPTDCNRTRVDGRVLSSQGAEAPVSVPFQVGDCDRLGLKPKLALGLTGATARNGHPALTATLTQAPGQANVGSLSLTLPRSELLAQEHIRAVCTRAQFAQHACPARSVYGRAEAETPLTDQPFSGPVYLRASDHKLPDLVLALRGPASQPIEVDLDGRVDSVNGRIRIAFEALPDAPVSRLALKMQGGGKGLLANSRDLCARRSRASVRLVGQNGKRADRFPVVRSRCGRSPRSLRTQW